MKDLEQLVQYHDGDLTEADRLLLAERLKNEAELQNTLDLITDVECLIGDRELASFEENVKEAEASFLQKKAAESRLTLNFWMKAAAILVVLVSAALFFLVLKNNVSLNNDELFAAYYEKLPADFATRSDINSKDDFINAIKLYNENKYQEAITKFHHILKNDPSNNAARLFLGISLTETSDFESAAGEFKYILDQRDPIFEEHATWYLSLCYIKTQHPGLARPLLSSLVSSRSFYMVKASDLLKKLE
jgi:tetratricopeptide (TPR) repeat protein